MRQPEVKAAAGLSTPLRASQKPPRGEASGSGGALLCSIDELNGVMLKHSKMQGRWCMHSANPSCQTVIAQSRRRQRKRSTSRAAGRCAPAVILCRPPLLWKVPNACLGIATSWGWRWELGGAAGSWVGLPGAGWGCWELGGGGGPAALAVPGRQQVGSAGAPRCIRASRALTSCILPGARLIVAGARPFASFRACGVASSLAASCSSP